MKTLDMEYIETPIDPLRTSEHYSSIGIDDRLLSDKLDTFLRTRKVHPFSKFFVRIKQRYY